MPAASPRHGRTHWPSILAMRMLRTSVLRAEGSGKPPMGACIGPHLQIHSHRLRLVRSPSIHSTQTRYLRGRETTTYMEMGCCGRPTEDRAGRSLPVRLTEQLQMNLNSSAAERE